MGMIRKRMEAVSIGDRAWYCNLSEGNYKNRRRQSKWCKINNQGYKQRTLKSYKKNKKGGRLKVVT